MRRILLVDDEPLVLRTLQRMLRAEREWETTSCQSGADALGELAAAPVDVIVSDLGMPGMDGVTLLREVREQHPGVARIVLSGNAALSQGVRAAAVAHHYLAKPCPADTLRAAIARVLASLAALDEGGARRPAASVTSLPPVPQTFAAITAAVQDERAGAHDVAAIVERDVALASKVLQLVNGAYFGRGDRVTSIEWAVRLLGVNLMRSIVLSEEIFGRERDPARAAIARRVQRHSMATAMLARELAPDRAHADLVFAAALLHDAGKLLAEPGEDELVHATLGGGLLALWGLPDELVEPVTWHHQPQRCPPASRKLAALIHAADALVHERAGDAAAAPVDEAALAAFGPGALERWRHASSVAG